MILGPLDAEWGADHDATVRMCRQAIDRRVEMKNWPFDGLKNDRRGEKWPEFRWSMIPPLKSRRRGLSI